jgi:hypothetical protein
VDEAVGQVKERIKQVKAKRITSEADGLDRIVERIGKGRRYGIEF